MEVGSKEHAPESVISKVAPGRTPTCAGHDPFGCTVRHSDQSDIGILTGIESNQPQRGIPVGGGRPNHSEQVRLVKNGGRGLPVSLSKWVSGSFDFHFL